MIKNKEHFLNPYYFIPLPEKKTIVKEEEKKRITGKITYEIVTRTPLFIPNASCDSAFGDMGEHKSYDFYSYKELQEGEACLNTWDPVIPGSEIRGMMRSVYEALTGSCMAIANADLPIFYREGMRDFLSPGLLKKEGKKVILIAAKAVYWNKNEAEKTNYKDGQKLFYRAEEKGKGRRYVIGRPLEKSDKLECGYLLRGELQPKGVKFSKKENAAIFSPVKNQEITVFTEEYQFDFEKLLEAYQKDSGSYIAYTKAYKQFMEDEEKEYFPVYYKPVNVGKNKTMFHIAPAAITKSKYKNRVQELLGDFNACHISTGLCPACSLFGITDSESKQRGIASRLRFGDAVLKKENKKDQIYCEKIDLQELAGPHVSNAEMYLKRPAGAVEWNYDYWVELIDGKRKFHPYNAQLNGRKFYWHHADWNLENMKAKQNTERNLTVRPVADGVTFEGELFFDNITREQLMQMIYLCDLSRNAVEDENGITKQLGYKLGMGKPVGLGSIEMRIQSVKIRSFDAAKEDFYSEETIDFSNEEERSEYAVTYEEAGFLSENHIRDWFEMLMDLNVTKGITVAYPYTDKQLENMEETVEVTDGKGWKKKRKLGGFQWFVTNKGEKKNKQYLVKEEQKKAEKIEVPYLKVLKYDTGDNRQKHMYDDKKRREGKNKK